MRDFIATFDEKLATDITVMDKQTVTVDGKQQTGWSDNQIAEFKKLDEGDPIVIEGQLYIKDKNFPPDGMRPVGYWEYQKSIGKKDKKLNKGQEILETAGVSFS